MRYVFRKKLNYPYDNPLIQSEAKGTHAIALERMGAPCDWMIETLVFVSAHYSIGEP